MTIEILYAEVCNLYGDLFNIKYLERCLPEATFKYTAINEEPYFVSHEVNFIYLGSMTEKAQEIVIERLKPYQSKMAEMIQNGVLFLVTGNAIELFGAYIENEDGSQIEGLNLFDVYTKRDMLHRFNSLVLGQFEGFDVVGFKYQFTQMYGDVEDIYFIDIEKGAGINKKATKEGIHKNNFFGTHMLGPVLILNPLFTKYLLGLLGVLDPTLFFEEEIMQAYHQRLAEFKNKNISFSFK